MTTSSRRSSTTKQEADPSSHGGVANTSNNGSSSWLRLYLWLCVFRICNTFLIHSYFDPDEFWQIMEPAYCQVFAADQGFECQGFTWEWKRRPPAMDSAPDILSFFSSLIERSLWGPARTYASVVPVHLWFTLLKWCQWDTHWAVARGPLILFAVTVAAPLDLAVYAAALWMPTHDHPNPNRLAGDTTTTKIGHNQSLARWALFLSMSSWFHGYTLVRTFANGQEALALILAIALTGPELLGQVPNHPASLARSCLAFFLGGLSVAVRFTSVAAFVPLGVLLALQQPTRLATVRYLFVPCAVFGLAGVAVAMVVDRLFFGFWTIPFLGNFHFNVVLDYADLFGSHPPHWYFTAGLPAIAGSLLPFLLWNLLSQLRHSSSAPHQRRLWIIVSSYLLVMSFNAHKEFRYILPVLPLLCLLTAASVRRFFVGNGPTPNRTRRLVVGLVWCTANLVVVLYLGLFHQSGAIAVNHAIVDHAVTTTTTSSSTSRLLRVHYLTGGCHTTPLLSHLHVPNSPSGSWSLSPRFDTWHLNCSPQCRADPELVCETEQFARDPVGFVERSYNMNYNENYGTTVCTNNETNDEYEHCDAAVPSKQPHSVPPPDYVVTFSVYAPVLRAPLAELAGLEEVARFPHSIQAIRVGSWHFPPSPRSMNNNERNEDNEESVYTSGRRLELISGVEVLVDEIVLFAKKQPLNVPVS